MEFCIQPDEQGRGAPWARNRAAAQARGRLILWSDHDIDWCPNALADLTAALEANPGASYAYGGWTIIGGARHGLVQSNREFNGPRLLRGNYISTMSLMRVAHFPGFDENLGRLQDWELYVRMLKDYGRFGVYCGSLTFCTGDEGGITASGHESWQTARDYIARKHHLDVAPRRMVRGL